MKELRPKIIVRSLIIKDGMMLMVKENGLNGLKWELPGGHLEFAESLADCAKRETLEESGIVINNVRFLCVTENIFREIDKHYITIIVAADYISGSPEADGNEIFDAGWFEFTKLPPNISDSLKNMLDNNCYPNDWKGSWSSGMTSL